MNLLPRAVLVVLGMLVPVCAKAGTTASLPEPGPENGGLRLRLVITPQGTGGIHTVTVELQNTGPRAVNLVGEWDYEENSGDYKAFFERWVRFLTYPEVQPESFQTAGGERHSPQPEQGLSPGESLIVSWSVTGNQIRGQSPFPGTTPVFPSPGLYGIKASILVVTKEGARILLVSNEQPLAIRGSRGLPKFATARILSANPDRNQVKLDVGSDQRIEPGDTFEARWGLMASWRITITKVSAWSSVGSVKLLRGELPPHLPEHLRFPQEGWQATLEPKQDATQR